MSTQSHPSSAASSFRLPFGAQQPPSAEGAMSVRKLSFGKILERHRLDKGLSPYQLSTRSDVPLGNLQRLEAGERGVPEFSTVFNLAMGLQLPAESRQDFMKVALRERLEDEIEQWCVYYFLAAISDEDFDRLLRIANGEKRFHRGIKGTRGDCPPIKGEPLDTESAYHLLLQIAADPKLKAARHKVAASLLTEVRFNLAHKTVEVSDGAFVEELTDDNHRTTLVHVAQAGAKSAQSYQGAESGIASSA